MEEGGEGEEGCGGREEGEEGCVGGGGRGGGGRGKEKNRVHRYLPFWASMSERGR